MVVDNSWNEDFEQVKEELDRLREEEFAYETEKGKLEKTLLQKEVSMKKSTSLLAKLEECASS